MTTVLSDLAGVFRSKNADPFVTTIDICFSNPSDYLRVKESQVLTKESIAEAYKFSLEAVEGVYFVDPIQTVKISIFKYANGKFLGQGDPELSDMYGAQQHIPLLDIEVP